MRCVPFLLMWAACSEPLAAWCTDPYFSKSEEVGSTCPAWWGDADPIVFVKCDGHLFQSAGISGFPGSADLYYAPADPVPELVGVAVWRGDPDTEPYRVWYGEPISCTPSALRREVPVP